MYKPLDDQMICYNRMLIDVYVMQTVVCGGVVEIYIQTTGHL